jgi:hypothetical protein
MRALAAELGFVQCDPDGMQNGPEFARDHSNLQDSSLSSLETSDASNIVRVEEKINHFQQTQRTESASPQTLVRFSSSLLPPKVGYSFPCVLCES